MNEVVQTVLAQSVLLEGQRIILRPLMGHDSPILEDWIKKEEYIDREHPFVDPVYYTEPDTRVVVVKTKSGNVRGEIAPDGNRARVLTFAITPKEAMDLSYGFISLANIHYVHGFGEVRFLIGPPHRKKGYASEALMLLMQFIFEDMGFYKICADRVKINSKSHEVLTHCGFEVAGIRRDHVKIGKRRFDLVLGEIFAEAYGRAVAALEKEERAAQVLPLEYNRYLRLKFHLRFPKKPHAPPHGSA